MKALLAVTLGILTSIGGFVDIGDLVASAVVGARYGMALAWVVIVGVVGIIVYAEMSARVAALSGRAAFDVVRERLGPRAALLNLSGSFLTNLLTMAAEIGGVALALELLTSASYLLWVPTVAVGLWLVIWRLPFATMERLFGLAGLSMLVFIVALWQLHPEWTHLTHQALHPHLPKGEGHPTYFYYAIALFGSAMTPYEVFFFSSGAVEEHWSPKELGTERTNVFVGFPLGGLLSLAITGVAAVALLPQHIEVAHLDQTALPVVLALGKVGLAIAILGFVAVTFGAALETSLSAGYMLAQYFGWSWGKMLPPREASRFHASMLASILAGSGLLLTTLDPIKVTEYSLVFSAVALPLTYFPILVVANDPDYMKERVNGWVANAFGTLYLIIVTAAAAAAIPLMIATKAGQ